VIKKEQPVEKTVIKTKTELYEAAIYLEEDRKIVIVTNEANMIIDWNKTAEEREQILKDLVDEIKESILYSAVVIPKDTKFAIHKDEIILENEINFQL
jgi:5,10-methenyltetrahydromethanopterin hydrogenase